ncbi:chalcone isomerase family protein [uncultured Rhodoferax sp.]|uniref:chalcone isomerase family protein n=1 Tax=uncultured Rhodoferax sp. TaxID=223188 RepID=UPI0025D72D3F|nr:chalcone isomerase family protein [uncultured Rhodoferax sp.]
MTPWRCPLPLTVAPSLLAMALFLGLPATASAQATAPRPVVQTPAELAPYGAGWQARGSGVLRFFGIKAYDATLWLPGADAVFSFAKPFALDIRYAVAVKGRDISNTSLIELQRISTSSPEQILAWSKWMESTFVDVKSGDQLIGVHLPGEGARFFLNGKLLGESSDPAFSEAFFKIWLDPKTKRPELRTALLGAGQEPQR